MKAEIDTYLIEEFMTEEFWKTLAYNLKIVRQLHPTRLSQKEMADILHVERQHINRIENGRVLPTIKEVMVYSELFDVPIKYLIYSGDIKRYVEVHWDK